MPLKHHTETLFVFLLGVVIAFTGMLIATLPSLPEGIVPWGVLLLLSLLYPASLHSLYRKRRADYTFRLLHWMPVAMLVIWSVLDLITLYREEWTPIQEWYTWGWTLPAVTIGFMLTISFCLTVIRRRVSRLGLLFLAFVPFTVAAVTSEQGAYWDQEIASVIWQGDWWRVDYSDDLFPTRTTTIVMKDDSSSSKNLSTSTDTSEEEWRERLRQMEKRRDQMRRQPAVSSTRSSLDGEESSISSTDEESTSSVSVVTENTVVNVVTLEDGTEVVRNFVVKKEESSSSKSMVLADAGEVLSGTGEELREAKTRPNNLPSSGSPFEAMGIFAMAGYLGTLHQRARKHL